MVTLCRKVLQNYFFTIIIIIITSLLLLLKCPILNVQGLQRLQSGMEVLCFLLFL